MNPIHTHRSIPKWFLSVMVFIILITAFVYGTGSLSSRNTQRMKETLEQALAKDVTDYYANHGRYPSSLQFIVDTYGLNYDTELFFVDYRITGSNLRPVIVVLERSDKA